MKTWDNKRGLKVGDIVTVPSLFEDKKYKINRFLDNNYRAELVSIEDGKGWFITYTYNLVKEEKDNE